MSILKLLLAVIFLSTFNANAARFVVKYPAGILLSEKIPRELLNKSVGEITVAMLNAAHEKGKISYIGDANFIQRIDVYGTETRPIDATTIHSMGWCYRVNRTVSEKMPNEEKLTSKHDRLVWFYGYTELKNGVWGTQCIRQKSKTLIDLW